MISSHASMYQGNDFLLLSPGNNGSHGNAKEMTAITNCFSSQAVQDFNKVIKNLAFSLGSYRSAKDSISVFTTA